MFLYSCLFAKKKEKHACSIEHNVLKTSEKQKHVVFCYFSVGFLGACF